MSGGLPMTGAEPQVSGHPCFLPEVLGGGDKEVIAIIGPGLSPTSGPLAFRPVVTVTTLSQSALSFPIPHPRISGALR